MISALYGLADGVGRQDGADRHARAEALRERDEVGRHADALCERECARPADAGLHLVEDQLDAVLIAQTPQLDEVRVRRNRHPGHALDRLEDNGGDVVIFRQDVGHGIGVAEGHEMRRRQDVPVGCAEFLDAGRRDAAQRAAVEAAFHRDHACASGRRACKFQRRFVGFGARVAEEHVAQTVRRKRCQQLGGGSADWTVHDVRVEEQLRRLFLDGLDHARRAMAQRRHAVAAVKVEVTSPLGIPDKRTLTSNERDWEPAVNGKLTIVFDGKPVGAGNLRHVRPPGAQCVVWMGRGGGPRSRAALRSDSYSEQPAMTRP